ncbi:hypothetical protein L758_20260 [Mycobacterium tuberculosis TRS1]|nr:hypothetical protein ER17_20050 [Mycobacterium tuberculosis]ALE45277.1 hypothetical protein AA885_19850 [Mycobacterium tuberculosis variant bovis]AQN84571.1 hypothetical protein L766_20215 [Mycobacterium tuberculosis TRS9]AQN88466.1 hypothetical protein L787_20085 [Mycobacterium tuberculosis 1821ADB35]AQN92360.1 hypothetical protein L789_20100 [Mycobacterium tuberculosis 1821ADB37]AQN96248.1 hypothetical protein L790_20215 [Mycobacterium tuberculosis 1821ADB38]AQO00130.1 hypothetical prote
MAVGRGPDDGAVGQLHITPAGPEGLEKVVFAAEAFQVGRVGGPEWVGQCVVDVAEFGGLVAAGESAGHVSDPDEFGQLGRRPVVRLRSQIAGMAHAAEGGPTADQLGQQWRGHHTPAADQRGRRLDRRGGGCFGCQRGFRAG